MLLFPIFIVIFGAFLAALGAPSSLQHKIAFWRLSIGRGSLILALMPTLAFIWLAWQVPTLNAGDTLSLRIPWLPSVGLSLGLYYDSLSALFALLVTLIGALIVVYSGQYFKGDPKERGAWRFQVYILSFMAAMMGLVMAGDVITLFIFWEATSIISYLLVAYKYEDQVVRRNAFKALFITGGGGIALLAGLLFVAYTAGDTQLSVILLHGDALRNSPYYGVMLALVAFGAFTKSAQFPAHIWLPGAMHAPTPASAYLHSATMVKAGIYLMARLNPALGFTETWFWLLTIVGMITMLLGAYQGLKQNDLKALLAYSTISQLGIMMMLIGQDDETAYKALVIGVLAHALYKSALFMVAGIVDHETGTRDLRRLGGLWRVMPFTFGITMLAALSMAGLPPLFGFLAKETLLATSIHPSLPPVVSQLFTWGSVLAGSLMLAMAGMLIWDGFLGSRKDSQLKAHEAPFLMWLMPAIPAVLSLIFAQLPGPKDEATFLASAASVAFGEDVKVSLKLWTGLNVPFLLSIVAVSLGLVIFIFRRPVREFQKRMVPSFSFDRLYDGVVQAIDRAAQVSTRLQSGSLRFYLSVIVSGALLVTIWLSRGALIPNFIGIPPLSIDFRGELLVLRVFSIFVVVGASLATVFLRRDFAAILALGALGLGMTVLFVLEPAPDVALVQVVVDILSVVILVLALTRLPREQRREAAQLRDHPSETLQPGVLRDVLVALGIGVLTMILTLGALRSRPHPSDITTYYEGNAKKLTGALDIVGAIITDFRATDTLFEIVVFSIAGLGVFTLLHYVAHLGTPRDLASGHGKATPQRTYGIGGLLTSAFIRLPSYSVLPLSIILAITHIMYGHEQPGDGFTAGVIISLAIGLWYVVFGYDETRRRLPWLKPFELIITGVLLAIVTGVIAIFFTGSFLGNVDFGVLLGIPLPRGFHFSTSFLFEVAICLSVLGSASIMLDSLGHPEHPELKDQETNQNEQADGMEEMSWKS